MFNEEVIKELIKNFLISERKFYEFLDEGSNKFKIEIETIKRLESHLKNGEYDKEFKIFCDYITNEFLKECDKIYEKEKKGKKNDNKKK